MNLSDMTLEQLFDESDAVGDKYLTTEEIQTRESQLQAARERVEGWIDALIDADESAYAED